MAKQSDPQPNLDPNVQPEPDDQPVDASELADARPDQPDSEAADAATAGTTPRDGASQLSAATEAESADESATQGSKLGDGSETEGDASVTTDALSGEGDEADPLPDQGIADQPWQTPASSGDDSDGPSSFVVGIGASAGGLEPLQSLFDRIPDSSGLSFVVVQHLSPDFKSLMKELLARHTSMAVHRVEDGMELEPNSVYLIPPKMNMAVREGKLRLEEQDDRRHASPNFPIDIFFRSLAKEYAERAVGVILSGTGSDGTRGAREISEAGGLVVVQEPTEAPFDGMPRAAIDAGVSTQVLSISQMPDALHQYVTSPLVPGGETPSASQVLDPGELTQILSLIKREEGVDFSHYKRSTITRRVQRRMLISGYKDLSEYTKALIEDDQEREGLRQDLLIGVTAFFRNPEVWRTLSHKILPRIVEQSDPAEPLRVWVTACSTGEEAYTLAMLLSEQLKEADKNLTVKIFATDIDGRALERAAAGMYHAGVVNDVGPERIKKFFEQDGERYRVKRSLREMVIFARHDLTRDVPLTRMHLVCCRNTLIYMQPELQRQVLSTLHYALIRHGAMILGTAETVGDLSPEFYTLDHKHKIFEKRRDVTLPLASRQPLSSKHTESQSDENVDPSPSHTFAGGANAEGQEAIVETIVTEAFGSSLQDRHAACLLIDEKQQLLHSFGNVDRYLSFSQGRGSLNVMNLLPESIATPMKAAIHRVSKANKPIRYTGLQLENPHAAEPKPNDEDGASGDLSTDDDAQDQTATSQTDVEAEKENPVSYVDMRVTHHGGNRNVPAFSAIILEPSTSRSLDRPHDQAIDASEADTERVRDLEDELQQTRENLQATIEELETTNEEQQATNEEMLASNEELQSTNEELHSVNEELYTVNSEYQEKIRELTRLNDDMSNLLANTNIGTVFLDRELNIRKFTPAATKVFNLVSQDVGRPIEHLSPNFEDQSFFDDLRSVLESGEPSEKEVTSRDGSSLLLRAYPYRTQERGADGVVITLVDVSDLKSTQGDLQETRRHLEHRTEQLEAANAQLTRLATLVEASDDAIISQKIDGTITTWNDGAERVYGYSSDNAVGASIEMLIPEDRREEYQRITDRLKRAETIDQMQTVHQTRDGGRIDVSLTASPIRGDDGEVASAVIVARDVTSQRRETRQALQLSEDRLQAVAQTAPDAILTFNNHGEIEFVNRTGCAMFGYDLETLMGMSIDRLIERENDGQPVRWHEFASVPDEGGGDVEEVVGICDDGERFPAYVSVGTFTRSGGRLFTAIVRDITERRETEAKVQESETHFRLMADALPALIAYVDSAKRYRFINAAYERWFGRTAESFVGQPLTDTVDRDDEDDIDKQLDQVFRDGQTYACSTRIRTGEDQAREVNAIFVPHVDNRSGKVLGLYALMTDITELKHAEQALRGANEQLEAKNREMEQFVYTVSHDLKSPLVTIAGLLGYLRKEVKEGRVERVDELADTLDQTASRMRETIEDLLELSRIGRVSDDPEPLDLVDTARDVIEDIQAEIDRRGATVEVTLPDNLPPVLADRGRLRQVFDNLITNALKYGCTEEARDCRVLVGGHLEGDRILVFVRDFGPGIDAEHHERVFGLFRRLDTSSNGSGVGLTIVKRVMETLGGQIWIESEPNQGAAFWLEFPVAEEVEGDDKEDASDAEDTEDVNSESES